MNFATMDGINSDNLIEKVVNVETFSDYLKSVRNNLERSDNLEQYVRKVNMQLIKAHQSYYFDNNLKNILKYVFELFENCSSSMNATIHSDLQFLTSTIQILSWHKIFKKTFHSFLQSIIESKIRDIASGRYSEKVLPDIIGWINADLSSLVHMLFGNAKDQNELAVTILNNLVNCTVHSSFSRIRSFELFDIVVDYPNSIPALTELRDSISIADSIGEVGQNFRSIVQKRLLHMGASTSQILDVYILIIKALRILDSSDLLLNFVARPIRQYLLSRKDTVRCIIVSLTDNSDSNLYTELKKGLPLSNYALDEEEEEIGEFWMPRKRNPLLQDTSRSKGKDILTVLVSIYGSSDIFVKEYRSLLAEKLISTSTYNIDQEIGTVELLKIR